MSKNSSSWKLREALVASWLGTFRNITSGSNNRNDDGSRRLGDVIYKYAVIEVKQHKTISMHNVPQVKNLAMKNHLPWALVEFKKGAINLVKLTVDNNTAEYIFQCLDQKWRDEAEKRKALS